MIFAGIDVNIITHARLIEACAGGDLAPFGLWTFGMCYAQLHTSDGRLPRAVVLAALGGKRNIMLAAKLVACGLWIANDGGSWTIWNYARKNQTSDEIAAKRAKAADRVKRWRERVCNASVTPSVTRNERVRTDPPPEPDNTTRHQGIGTAPPPPESSGVTRPRRKPETACPESAAEPPAVSAWASGWKIPTEHPEFAHFLDHHRKGDARWRDWTAAWRTWLRNASRFGQRSLPRGGHVQSSENRAWVVPKEMP